MISNEKMFKKMVDLQYKMNVLAAGKNWESGITKDNKVIDWLLTIEMELSELMDSTPWKHWKKINSQIDTKNIKIELVDIWHFIMSYLLEEKNQIKTVEKINLLYETYFNYEIEEKIVKNDLEVICTEGIKELYFDMKKTIFKLIDKRKDKLENRLIINFFNFLYYMNFELKDMYKIYIGKNCLNEFRQNNGYKDGTYKKEWKFGNELLEDNKVMLILLDKLSISETLYEEMYRLLSEEYHGIFNNNFEKSH